MLTRIEVENFQRHGKLTLDLDPRCTTIVGRSHRGKSSVVRALAFGLLNVWDRSFQKNPKDEPAKVTLHLDGHTIVRTKSSRVNTVELDGKAFAALGKDGLPPEVERLLNVGRDNFQLQLDPHFWFADSPGQVAKNINRMVDLEVIDDAQAEVAARLRKAKGAMEAHLEEAARQKLVAKELAWVVKFDADLKAVERLGAESDEIAEKHARIVSVLRPLAELKSSLGNVVKAKLDGETVVSLGARLAELTRQHARLDKILTRLDAAKPVKAPDIAPLVALRAKADELADRHSRCDELVQLLTESEANLCQTQNELSSARKSLEEAEKKLPRCPTCGALTPATGVSRSRSSVPTCTSHTHRPATGPKKAASGTT